MNREIKFRGKSLNTGLWSYGDLRQDNIRRKAYIEYEADPETIGQFTELTDCKGKEIYEGDILSFTVFDAFGGDRQHRGTVRYCGSRFMIWLSLDGDVCLDLDWVIEQDDELEIIGNINDNPELTKQ
nr:MAG TPA: YopX protein [Caudoviricetes sp.]